MGLFSQLLRHLPVIRPGREQALSTTERICAVTHLLSSVEHLVEPGSELPAHANDWARLQSGRYRSSTPVTRKLLSVTADRRVVNGLHVVRIGAALVLLAPTPRRARLAANAVLTVTSAWLYPHHAYGSDGTDQASFLTQSAATVARAGGDRPALVDAALWYIASQGTLSYAVSGWAKMLGPLWRNGKALPGVLRTYTYGDQRAYQLVQRFPRAARVVGAGVLALECLFPAAYLARGRLSGLFVGSAAVFHLANARVMGLSRFLPAFLAMHPAVLYTAGPRQVTGRDGRSERRDDLFPVTLAVTGALGAATMVAQYHRRRRAVTRGRPGEQRLTTSTGNVLAFRRGGCDDPAAPLVVIEGGLAATIEQNIWLQQHLERRCAVVSYQRAGYGSSSYRWRGDYDLDVSVRDLVDLVADQAGDRPVVIVGHSLGGYLAWRAAPRLVERLGDQIKGLALVDATHPDELLRSATQHSGAELYERHFNEVAVSLRMGLGALTSPPTFVRALPAEVRDLAVAQYADPGLWATARREWRGAKACFIRPDSRLRPIELPAVVLTASHTATTDPIQVELHDEMAAAATWSRRHIVPDTGHDSIVVAQAAAARAVALIADFIDEAVAAPARGKGRTGGEATAERATAERATAERATAERATVGRG